MTYDAEQMAKGWAATHAVKIPSGLPYERFIEALTEALQAAYNAGYSKGHAALAEYDDAKRGG